MKVQDKILSVCFDSFMKFGVKSVSMDDIAKQLGVSKKTIYSHFENKHNIVKEVVASFVEKDLDQVKNIVESSRDAIDAMISLASHVLKMLRSMSPTVTYDLQKYYPDIWQIVDNKHNIKLYDIILNNINRGINEGYYRKDIVPDIVAKFYIELTKAVADPTKFKEGSHEMSAIFKELIRYHLYSILTPKGIEYIKQQEII